MKTYVMFLCLVAGNASLWAESCCHKKAPEQAAAKSCCSAAHETVAATTTQSAQAFSGSSLYQLDARFTDDEGNAFALGQLRGRPVVLAMFFSSCTYACPMLVSDISRIRAALPEGIRGRAVIVLVSFDTVRDTPVALRQFRTARSLDEQWVLLHGDDAAVRELAALLGVKYKQDADGGFAHSNLITVLNVEGESVHQRKGLTGGLDEAAQAVAAASVSR